MRDELRDLVADYKAGNIQNYDDIMRALATIKENCDDDAIRTMNFEKYFYDNQQLFNLYKTLIVDGNKPAKFLAFANDYLYWRHNYNMVKYKNGQLVKYEETPPKEYRHELTEAYSYLKHLMFASGAPISFETFLKRLPQADEKISFLQHLNPFFQTAVKLNKYVDVKCARDFYPLNMDANNAGKSKWDDRPGVPQSDANLDLIKHNFYKVMHNLGYVYCDEQGRDVIDDEFVPPGYENYVDKYVPGAKYVPELKKEQRTL